MRNLIVTVVVLVVVIGCSNDDTETRAVLPPMVDLVMVDAGGNRVCGVQKDGSIVCNGYGEDELMAGPQGAEFETVSVSSDHNCGIVVGGSLACWGSNRHGKASPPQGQTFRAVSAGETHTCGIRSDASLVCWGRDDFGITPTIPRSTKYRNVSAGRTHTCAVRDNGMGECWGIVFAGKSEPDLRRQFIHFAVGSSHACGLLVFGEEDGGNVECWGANQWRQSDPPVDLNLTAIAVGKTFTCGLRQDQTAMCWGENRTRGLRTEDDGPLPEHYSIDPPDGMKFNSLTAGDHHACGLRENATSFCWGYMADLST